MAHTFHYMVLKKSLLPRHPVTLSLTLQVRFLANPNTLRIVMVTTPHSTHTGHPLSRGRSTTDSVPLTFLTTQTHCHNTLHINRNKEYTTVGHQPPFVQKSLTGNLVNPSMQGSHWCISLWFLTQPNTLHVVFIASRRYPIRPLASFVQRQWQVSLWLEAPYTERGRIPPVSPDIKTHCVAVCG